MRRIIAKSVAIAVCSVTLATAAMSQQGPPVAASCKDDIAKFCAGMEHGQGKVRACLEDKVTVTFRTALENTGPGTGMGGGQK